MGRKGDLTPSPVDKRLWRDRVSNGSKPAKIVQTRALKKAEKEFNKAHAELKNFFETTIVSGRISKREKHYQGTNIGYKFTFLYPPREFKKLQSSLNAGTVQRSVEWTEELVKALNEDAKLDGDNSKKFLTLACKYNTVRTNYLKALEEAISINNHAETSKSDKNNQTNNAFLECFREIMKKRYLHKTYKKIVATNIDQIVQEEHLPDDRREDEYNSLGESLNQLVMATEGDSYSKKFDSCMRRKTFPLAGEPIVLKYFGKALAAINASTEKVSELNALLFNQWEIRQKRKDGGWDHDL